MKKAMLALMIIVLLAPASALAYFDSGFADSNVRACNPVIDELSECCTQCNPCDPCNKCEIVKTEPSLCYAGYSRAKYDYNAYNTGYNYTSSSCPVICNACDPCNTCNPCNGGTFQQTSSNGSCNTCDPCLPKCAPLCKGVIEGRAIPCGNYVDVVYIDCGKDKTMRINTNCNITMTPSDYKICKGDVIRVEYSKNGNCLMANSITRKEVGNCIFNR